MDVSKNVAVSQGKCISYTLFLKIHTVHKPQLADLIIGLSALCFFTLAFAQFL